MGTNSEDGTRSNRKPYQKPQVRQVLLRAEEAVLGACKTQSGAGPAQSRCHLPHRCTPLGS
jgi:hypothetical protein